MSHTFEQFVRFTTDAVGLERTLRLFQAITQILSSYALPLRYLLLLLAYLSATPHPTAGEDTATARAVLLGLHGRLALARRYFRLFRFLESFHAAQKVYVSLSSSPSPTSTSPSHHPPALSRTRRAAAAASWLDVFGRTFNGMYLLLEASTIADAQRVPGLALWGPEREAAVAVEGQRFWLFSLVCGVLAGSLRIADVLLASPTPPAVAASGAGSDDEGRDAKKKEGGEKKSSTSSSSAGEGNEEKENLAEVVDDVGGRVKDGGDERRRRPGQGRDDDELARRREVRSRVSGLGRRVVADALDITLPGAVVGWVPVSTGTVGLAMFVTTILTGMDVWERCGREVAESKK